MGTFSREAKIGIFFLACLAIIIYTWFRVLDFSIKEGFELKARFESVEGLVEGAQVQIAGIKVGQVKQIRFDQDTGKALVILEIKDEYRDSIPRDSRLLMRTKGLLGDRYLVIEPGKPNTRKFRPNEEFRLVVEPTDTEKIIETLSVVSEDVKQIAREFRRQIIDKKGGEKIGNILSNTETASKEIRDVLARNRQKLDRTFTNIDEASQSANRILTDNKENINKTLEGASGFATTLNRLVTDNKQKIDNTIDRVAKFSGNLENSGPKFERMASDFSEVAGDLREGRGTVGRLIQDETLYVQATSLVGDVRRLAHGIQYGPGVTGRLINDPELYFEARRAVRNLNKTAEDISEATPISTLAVILGAVLN